MGTLLAGLGAVVGMFFAASQAESSSTQASLAAEEAQRVRQQIDDERQRPQITWAEDESRNLAVWHTGESSKTAQIRNSGTMPISVSIIHQAGRPPDRHLVGPCEEWQVTFTQGMKLGERGPVFYIERRGYINQTSDIIERWETSPGQRWVWVEGYRLSNDIQQPFSFGKPALKRLGRVPNC